jgi:hypothetical protein
VTPEPPALPPKRKPFAAIRKGIIEHVISGRLQGLRFAIYIWLHLLADHTRGTARTNAARVASDLGLHPVTTRRHLAALKRDGYIRYASMTGREQLYEITIEKFQRTSSPPESRCRGCYRGRYTSVPEPREKSTRTRPLRIKKKEVKKLLQHFVLSAPRT